VSKTVSLRAYQEELKKLLFFRDPEPKKSFLWSAEIPARLAVYRNNTRTNWTDTLNHDFALTRKQFDHDAWHDLQKRYFLKHAPQHWELNTSMAPFPAFLATQKVKPYVKELADFEWNDLKIFVDRAIVRKGLGVTNPTAVIRVYQHQMFYWVKAEAPSVKPPQKKAEVLLFYRDSKNTSHIQEADPLMILMMEHFRKPGARLGDLEPLREKLLPMNRVSLSAAADRLKKADLLLL
jgi:hypothetical protein